MSGVKVFRMTKLFQSRRVHHGQFLKALMNDMALYVYMCIACGVSVYTCLMGRVPVW